MKHLLFLLLSISIIHASDNTPTDISDAPLKCWTDATSFSGKIVAYRTQKFSYYFGSNNGFSIGSDSSLRYGIIGNIISTWLYGQPGFNMHRLLKKGWPGGPCPLTNSKIGKISFIRRATENELLEIRKAIDSEDAKFEYEVDKKAAHEMIDLGLKLLPLGRAFPH